MFSWKVGKRGGGYKILTLFRVKSFKVELCKIEEGASIREHIDDFEKDNKLYKMLVYLKKPKDGGSFVLNYPLIKKVVGRVCFFSPNEVSHFVTKAQEGSGYILFITWLKRRS